MSTEYQRGYLDGYRDVTTPDDAPTIGEQEAERQTFAEGMGAGPGNEEMGDYWIGYYHGRAHREHGEATDGARGRGEIPAGL